MTMTPPGPPPGWATPKPKRHPSTIPLAIALVVLVLAILGGGGYAAYLYTDVHKDYGLDPKSVSSNELCDRLSPETRQRARTTNLVSAGNRPPDADGSRWTICEWRQTKGKDGDGQRFLYVEIFLGDGATLSEYTSPESRLRGARQGSKDFQVEPLQGVGDEAYYGASQPEKSGRAVRTELAARTSTRFVKVDYQGFDVGVFTKRPPNPDDMRTAAIAIAQDILND
ncbi:hypothetical protein JOF53_005143 [Crossiella equi]|uniref:DUF3558 domain-containing protein n=1 Tax=Crossiella equi TaxID=130796 RepID=A0ABS5AIS0_9PSEU|nr:hypothetical protein [Crossiella equi]MBP2476271.1 hypothetical protein [Crossiella equi]